MTKIERVFRNGTAKALLSMARGCDATSVCLLTAEPLNLVSRSLKFAGRKTINASLWLKGKGL